MTDFIICTYSLINTAATIKSGGLGGLVRRIYKGRALRVQFIGHEPVDNET